MLYRPKHQDADRIYGLDLSKKPFKGCCLDSESSFEKHRAIQGQMNSAGQLKFISQLTDRDWVAIEGGSSSSNFALSIMENSKAQVFMLNPGKLHIIFRTSCKTDSKDAVKIAEILRDMHPSKWPLIPVPTRQEIEERSLVNEQIFYKKQRTSYINRLHSIFNLHGICDLKKSDLKENEDRKALIEMYFEDASAAYRTAMAENDMINSAELALETIEERIRKEIILAHPKEALAWLSIPSIGLLTAAACIAYIGNGDRFDSAAQLMNYVGLLPYISQSGESFKSGGVTAYGCMPIRRNIIQAAWSCANARYANSLTDYWNKLKARNKKGQKAAVAVANRMLTIGYALLKTGSIYRDCENYEYLERKLKANKITAINTSMEQMLKR